MSKPGILAKISRYLPFLRQERRSNYIDGDSNYLSIWQDNPSQPDHAVTVAAVHRCVSLISRNHCHPAMHPVRGNEWHARTVR
jgi:hypothetical protein